MASTNRDSAVTPRKELTTEYIEELECEIAALRAEVDRLADAISRHRSALWGDGEVEHPEDVELYAALGGKEKAE